MKVATTPANTRIYTFENFRLDAGKRLLFNDEGEIQPLMPKAFDILMHLISHKDQVVSKDELMSAFWPDTAVEENNLTQNISAIRRVLGEKHRENRFIATVPGRGYKFVADVKEVADPRTDDENAAKLADTQAAVDRFLPANKQGSNGAAVEPQKTKRVWLFTLAAITVLGLVSLGFLLRRSTPTSADAEIKSLAILPFKSLVAGKGDESLELGMADTLISKLSGAGDISIRPLSAVRRFAAYDQDPVAAGKALGVEAVMDGRIQISNDRIRVSATLFRVADEKQMWSGQFDEKLTDIFSVQDSISSKVATALKIPLTSLRREPHTDNVEAYQLYMKGNLHARRLIMPEVQKGITYYERAIAVDPTYARAYIGLEQAYRAMILTNDAPPNEMIPKAKAAIRKAIELDPSLPDAWNALAVSDFWYDWNWRAAESHHQKALELDPNNAQSYFFYAHLLSNTGRHEEALAAIKRAREIDPVMPVINTLEGQVLSAAGREDEAMRVLQDTIDANPDFWLAHLFLSRVYINKAMYMEALASAAKARDLTGGNAEAVATVGRVQMKLGNRNEALRVLAELEDRAKTRFVPAYTLAQIQLALGDREKTLDLLEKAVEEHDALLVFLKIDREWDELRNERRFMELSRKINL